MPLKQNPTANGARALWNAMVGSSTQPCLYQQNSARPAQLSPEVIAMTECPFTDHRAAALALLIGTSRLSRKAGQFLGQLAVDPSPMTAAQADWLKKLLNRANLPPVQAGEM